MPSLLRALKVTSSATLGIGSGEAWKRKDSCSRGNLFGRKTSFADKENSKCILCYAFVARFHAGYQGAAGSRCVRGAILRFTATK